MFVLSRTVTIIRASIVQICDPPDRAFNMHSCFQTLTQQKAIRSDAFDNNGSNERHNKQLEIESTNHRSKENGNFHQWKVPPAESSTPVASRYNSGNSVSPNVGVGEEL